MAANLSATALQSPAISVTRRWIGRVVSALVVLFMIFDAAIKVLQLSAAVDASAQLGLSSGVTLVVGAISLICLAIYLIPSTAPLGAILLTGYLGGAMAIQVRAGAPPFSVVFPLIIGALLWVGLYLRDARLRALLPL